MELRGLLILMGAGVCGFAALVWLLACLHGLLLRAARADEVASTWRADLHKNFLGAVGWLSSGLLILATQMVSPTLAMIVALPFALPVVAFLVFYVISGAIIIDSSPELDFPLPSPQWAARKPPQQLLHPSSDRQPISVQPHPGVVVVGIEGLKRELGKRSASKPARATRA